MPLVDPASAGPAAGGQQPLARSSRVIRTSALVLLTLSLGVRACPAEAQVRRLGVVPEAVIGVLTGPSELVFGDISGIAADSTAGVIFVFDRLSHRLSAFTTTGRFVAAAGRTGSGPAEFRSPILPVLHESLIYMPDAMNGRITQWRLSNGDLQHMGQTRPVIPIVPAFCAIADRIYFLRYHDRGLIQALRLDGQTVASFGAPFHTAPGLNPAFLSGRIACDQRLNAIYVASGMSILRRYDASTGALRWETTIPGVVPPRVEVDTRAGLPRFSRPRGQTSQYLVSIVSAPGGLLLVQLADPPRSAVPGYSGTDIIEVTTLVFDAGTGRLIESRHDLPRLDYSVGSRAYSWPAVPFPQVRIYRWR
jgi:hypothetical protein